MAANERGIKALARAVSGWPDADIDPWDSWEGNEDDGADRDEKANRWLVDLDSASLDVDTVAEFNERHRLVVGAPTLDAAMRKLRNRLLVMAKKQRAALDRAIATVERP